MFKLRSVNNIVIAPANTGNESKSKIAVKKTDHTNKGIKSANMSLGRMFKTVLMKLTAPKIEEIPAR